MPEVDAMKKPSDNEVVFSLTRATADELFARGYVQGLKAAGKPQTSAATVAFVGGVIVGLLIVAPGLLYLFPYLLEYH